MDDDMETEIIREVLFGHLHLVWKYVSVTSSGLAEMILPGPGETFKSKIFQPGPFMLITLVIIISSIVLQTKHNWLQKALLTCHKTISLNVVADHSLKSFVSASVGNENVAQELTEGIVGVYALQGRRGTMEDRFSVMQEVDVGGSSKPSFYGVYDGHGGQFVAEYVKQNLFLNTVMKIRQTRSSNKEKNGGKARGGESLGSDKRRKSCPSSPAGGLTVADKSAKDRRPSSSATYSMTHDANLNVIKEQDAESADAPRPAEAKSTLDKNPTTSSAGDTAGKETTVVGCKVEEVKEEKGEEVKEKKYEEEECSQSLKKEDPYSCLTIKKRNSVSAAASDTTPAKEGDPKKDTPDTNSYIDINSNINYTKLLSDQIMDIDQKIVNFCKSKTDLSGTTAVIAVLDGELLIIGNVGDSRAVMGDLKGSTIPLSFDHKPNQLKERRRIKEAGGFISFTGVWRVAGILATSRALGDFPLKDPRKLITAEPDVLTFSLKDHKAHFVILATDGLWDVLSNEEAVAFVRDHITELDYGARSLVLHAYQKGSQDNITALILNLSKLSL